MKQESHYDYNKYARTLLEKSSRRHRRRPTQQCASSITQTHRQVYEASTMMVADLEEILEHCSRDSIKFLPPFLKDETWLESYDKETVKRLKDLISKINEKKEEIEKELDISRREWESRDCIGCGGTSGCADCREVTRNLY